MTEYLIPIVIVLVLVAINGVFVAAEFALVAAQPGRLEALAENGNRAGRWLVDLIEQPTGKDGYIAVAQLGITLASIGLGMYGEPAVAHWLYDPFERWGMSSGAAHTVGFIIALSAITFLHVVLGEMIPKALALQEPENVSVRVNPVMRFFGLVFRPMVFVLNWLALALMRLLRIPEPDKRLSLYTSAELAIVTDESADSGQLGSMQRELIHNVFELEERTAEEIMTPRNRIRSVELDADAASLDDLVASSTTSRYPVIDGSLDNVVGVLHIKDVIRAKQRGRPVEVPQLLRHLPSVPAAASAEQVLQRFQREHVHAALVVDEAGGTLGLVTMDDVISIVMEDEFGAAAGNPLVHGDGSISLDGDTTLAELADGYGITFDELPVTTLAGVALDAKASLPTVGESIESGHYRLTVEEMRGRQVVRVRVARTL